MCENRRFIFYDLETTGLGFHNKHKDIDIVEIGAVDQESRETFQQYIYPPGNHIPRDASNVHGIFLSGGKLFRDGKELEAVDLKTGLNNFLRWLKAFNQPVTLAGYNSHNFDDWVISHNFYRENFCALRDGLVKDFLDVSKMVRPYLKSAFGVKKWSLTFAVKTCLERNQSDAHSAVSDSIDTLDLLEKLAGENIPEKAYREVSYNQAMCLRISKGLPIEDPQVPKNKSISSKNVVDDKQLRLDQFFKSVTKQDNNKPLEESRVNSPIEIQKSQVGKQKKKKTRRKRSIQENDQTDCLKIENVYVTRSHKRKLEAMTGLELDIDNKKKRRKRMR